MSACTRCGDTILHDHPARRRIRATDIANSTGTFYEGRLCRPCWADLERFMAEDPTDPRWATA